MTPHAIRIAAERGRNSRVLALVDGWRAVVRSRAVRDDHRRLELVALAARRFAFAERPALIRRWCAPSYDARTPDRWRRLQVGWSRYGPGFGDITNDRHLRTSLILKSPEGLERGVVYMSFEYNLMRLVASGAFDAIQRQYWLVCSTSWSPTDYSLIGNVMAADGSPVVLGISHDVDVANFEALSPHVVPLPLLASDWLRPDAFRPRDRAARDLDIVMVANWTAIKRHWLLFEALQGLPADLKVVLIGRDGDGRTAETIRSEAARFGVRQPLELLTDIPHHEVRDLLCRARVSPLLSYREGSCVAVTEALLADTPVVMMNDGHVGSSRYIGPGTGRSVTRAGLGEALMHFIQGGRAAPRETVLGVCTAEQSSARLNDTLRRHATERGEPWRRDIAPLCWDGNPRYLDVAAEAEWAGAYDAFAEAFGVSFVGWRAARV